MLFFYLLILEFQQQKYKRRNENSNILNLFIIYI